MLYQFLAAGLLIAGMYLFLAFSIFLKASAGMIVLALLAVAIASQIFRNVWGKFEKKNPYPPRADRFVSTAFKLFGFFTAVTVVVFAAGVMVTGDLRLSLKFAGMLECLFLLDCLLLTAQV